MPALVPVSFAMLVAAARPVHADDEIVRGAVVKVEHQEIYVSLGSKQGVVDGAVGGIRPCSGLAPPRGGCCDGVHGGL